MYLGWECKSEFFWISVSSRYQKPDTLPGTNIAPARKPSQKEPIVFQLSIFREGNF